MREYRITRYTLDKWIEEYRHLYQSSKEYHRLTQELKIHIHQIYAIETEMGMYFPR